MDAEKTQRLHGRRQSVSMDMSMSISVSMSVSMRISMSMSDMKLETKRLKDNAKDVFIVLTLEVLYSPVFLH